MVPGRNCIAAMLRNALPYVRHIRPLYSDFYIGLQAIYIHSYTGDTCLASHDAYKKLTHLGVRLAYRCTYSILLQLTGIELNFA